MRPANVFACVCHFAQVPRKITEYRRNNVLNDRTAMRFPNHCFTFCTNQIIQLCVHCLRKKRGVELYQLLTKTENSFTVGNYNKLSVK